MKKVKKYLSSIGAIIKENILHTFIIAAVVVMMTLIICGVTANEHNRISEGVIVDKNYNAAYSKTTDRRISDGMTMPVIEYHPATYYFTIKGDKDGKIVEYTFEVTENDYNTYRTGDYYKR
ncbi:MAG: hypothetical protein HDT43_00895 [Ruminococcaceae bacterium]|nr:hypothetical protein [Oscillospiraceae bacterium]